MLQPSEFLDTAKLLAASHSGVPSDAETRRCISTAYYALFHTILTAGADRLFGASDRSEAGDAIVYRSFDHSRLKRVCEDITKSVLSPTMRRQLGRAVLHDDMRDFARSFVELQALRHGADYDPDIDFQRSDALAAIDRAELAIASFAAAPDDERSDVLALMLGGRS